MKPIMQFMKESEKVLSMIQYVAFLRGINVGGKNKVPMKDLKKLFEDLGYVNVKTYINSGNVIFSSPEENQGILIASLEPILLETFKFEIPITVVSIAALQSVSDNAPEWWGDGNKEYYHTAVFVIPPKDAPAIMEIMGAHLDGKEYVEVGEAMIYWTAVVAYFSQTKWSKIASTDARNFVTIRTANTVRKILALAATMTASANED